MIKIYENVIDSYIQNDESFCHVKQYAEYDKLMAHMGKPLKRVTVKVKLPGKEE